MSKRALRHWLEHAGFRTARFGSAVLPETVALRGGQAFGEVIGSMMRFRRSDVDRHLEWAFPGRSSDWRARVARACYRHFGREAVATLRAERWLPEEVRERTSTSGFEGFHSAFAEGRGLVLLTGHLGNWEIGGAAIAARGVPLDVIGKGMSNRRFQADLFDLRERLGMRVIEMGAASRLAPRALTDGRVVALLGDQSAHRGGVLVPFFGRAAATARGPALFAVRSQAPVYVAFALTDPGPRQRYAIAFERLPFAATGDTERDVTALTRAYTRILEAAIREAPEQYFWHHRRWKGVPAEELLSDG